MRNINIFAVVIWLLIMVNPLSILPNGSNGACLLKDTVGKIRQAEPFSLGLVCGEHQRL